MLRLLRYLKKRDYALIVGIIIKLIVGKKKDAKEETIEK